MCIPGRQHDKFELADIRVFYDRPHELFGKTVALEGVKHKDIGSLVKNCLF